ncbi:MAG: tripartite tricarboxylate transporter TctB family protein [Spirochaetia bacterium]|nr:tripartite tricarboxylate transporter TctB family protein [Spirochaetia bacterium]
MGKKLNKEIVCGIIFTIFALVYLVSSSFIPTMSLLKTLGSDFMPRIYGVLMLALGIGQVFVSLKKEGTNERNISEGNKEATQQKTQNDKKLGKEDKLNILYTFVAISFYIILMKPLGFIVSSSLYFVIQAVILTPVGIKRKYVLFLLIGVIASLFAFFLFRNLFNINLPSGYLL